MAEQGQDAATTRKPYRTPAAPRVVVLVTDSANTQLTFTPYSDGATTYASGPGSG